MIQIKDNDLPITVAQKIITGVKPYKHNAIQKAVYASLTNGGEMEDTVDMFELEEIEEIATYLILYCTAHSKGD